MNEAMSRTLVDSGNFHLWLVGLLATLRGHRDAALGRQRPESEPAHHRVAEAEAHLQMMRSEHAATLARLSELASAPAAYRAVLAEYRQLSESGDPRAVRLLDLADERGRLNGELEDLDKALRAAEAARDALEAVDRGLGRASGWSALDMFSRGAPVEAIKYTYVDGAKDVAAHADRCLAVLRNELADLEHVPPASAHLSVDATTWFLDAGWEAAVTDVAVDGRIENARDNIAVWMYRVRRARERLEQRVADTRDRLASIEAERGVLLADP
ncbi:hypothetical protein RB614_06385 [Phytohabitans sp. ZYX-F-186]|uniref:Uncharacterized protein n=1 Tax=Phytohabitans maris TaxID=3071409 RepID=A0ABU0ZCI7_9ACTN|nr:hypothetical protein [Phytohabitans sp. ZYX-F-186]MDQ7904149.1 hypothetical protein [Phytohabitans sp. ZYX-F-186]